MMNIIQVLLRRHDIETSASRKPPFGPDFPSGLVSEADMLVVLSSTEVDGDVSFNEFRLYRTRRLLGVRKVSCPHQNETRRRKLPLGGVPRARLELPHARTLTLAAKTAAGPAGGPAALIMSTTKDDAIELAVNAILALSSLVDRHCFGADPEEADEAQRQGHTAIEKLRMLKSGPTPAVISAGGQETGGEQEALAA